MHSDDLLLLIPFDFFWEEAKDCWDMEAINFLPVCAAGVVCQGITGRRHPAPLCWGGPTAPTPFREAG